ncbi:hypothetical protein LXM94_16145 [Rhizobium sp. TRM95111]|uniref:CopG family ribbon-helix-helix protein n=1 Tax=Rhizobium alarense TaxID=2846851 RepID=UPI001F3B58C4|nr:hypothetical protein [Rhizobium alarense]MCF3641504.1 hypothetical protein [Rhizobium alarense]
MAKALSIELAPEIETRLDAEARALNLSTETVAERAIAAWLDGQSLKRIAIDNALDEAGDGAFISSERMNRWIDHWGEDEIDPPEPDVFLPAR